MQAFTQVAHRTPLGASIGGMITRLNPGLLRSAVSGQGNAILLHRELEPFDYHALVLNPLDFRTSHHVGLEAQLAWAKERRILQAVRVRLPDDRRVLVGNLHATSYRASPVLATLELRRARDFFLALTQPGEIEVLGGDFNLRADALGFFASAGFSKPGPGDRSCARARSRCNASRQLARSAPADRRRPRLRPRTARGADRVNRDEARSAFPVLEHFAYLNAGSFGPLARTTVAAMEAQLERGLAVGRSGGPFMDELAELRDGVRARLAASLDVAPENVALTTSTTRGCNIAIAGLRLQPGDEAVTTDNEHFGLIGPLHASAPLSASRDLTGRPAAEAFDAIAAEVTPKTRLIAVSHVSWLTGHVLPLEQLRDVFDVPLLIDGAQSVGAMPVDASRYDFYTVSGQKWLCGPDTTGALYVADPDRLEVATPSYFAQQEYEPEGAFTAKEGAARFDSDWLAASLPRRSGLRRSTPLRNGATRLPLEKAVRCRDLLLAAGLEVVTEPGQSTTRLLRSRAAILPKRGGRIRTGRRRPRAAEDGLDPRFVRLLDERGGSRAASRRFAVATRTATARCRRDRA